MKQNAEALQEALCQFYGTEAYHAWSPLFRNFVLTDGTQYLAENAGAFWLMDLFASHYSVFRPEGFAVLRLERTGDTFTATITDGNDHILATQDQIHSDFPLDEIELFAAPADGGLWVIMLPGEY